MNNPLVSVIIPTKNSGEKLRRVLDRVAKQSYQKIEIVVVDGNSVDNTKEIARQYTENVINFEKKGDHRSAQRNLGATIARGEYILFLDSDMELSDDVVSNCVDKIQSDPGVTGVIIPEESFGQGFWAQCKKLEKSFYVGIYWMEAARFFRRQDFMSADGYCEDMTSGEDWDLSQRMEARGKIDRISNPIYHNEGRINLFKTAKKKFYYARTFSKYKESNLHQHKLAKQIGITDRYKLFLTQPNKLFKNPVIGLGMLVMKTCEFAAGGLGYVLGKPKSKNIEIEEYAKIAPQFYSQSVPELLAQYLIKEKWAVFLDCGCGDGALLFALKNKNFFSDKKVFAVDLSESRVGLVKELGNDISVNVDDVESLKTVADGSVDFLVSTQVIEHVDDRRMLESLNRVMAAGGTIYLSTVFKKWYGWYFYRNNGNWVIDPTHLREYANDRELLGLIENNQFEILENKKQLLFFPVIDFFVKRLHIKNRKIFDNALLRFIRKIKLPIPGYYHWEIVLKKLI